ncbi:putative outer membrane starch-binding protein [Bacteroides zoogleoformans]|uniref:RagB/SusD family nutrient uptake outer membrane protein n=1 Tax=Bacteroides zoogleoformans TaxID=28119 RepID=A0ABN5IIZ1_9BACE|nr:RagB/SusD family nutrient uptake outer membrane protein [Bacteroides zoogleoformans]AVM52787.1 RagB/SusD family nutrient uptake outer membrane protein [Bacteroides zoogleoformans]TWJ16619.1 putative outer membrane starch-binding protein [Bacteroides zoogleoformans]
MKKIFIYGTLALISLTSCNDLLDKEPLDTFSNTPEYWSNADNLDNQCNTFLNNYSGYGNAGGGGWFYFKTLSDDQVHKDNHTWTYTSLVSTSSEWSTPFVEIRRAAYIINGVQSSSLDDATKANYEGIARMNRAWQYYQLVRMFGNVQWIGQIVDPNDKEFLQSDRTDRDVVMDKVLEDLNYACTHMTGTNKQRFNKDMALAMKADICLWEGTFCKYRTANENGKAADMNRSQKFLQECASACEELIKKNYKLREDYQSIYNAIDLSSNPEIIFYKPYSKDAFMHSTIDYTVDTGGTHGMSKDAFDSYLFLDGKPLATTTMDKNDAAELDADGNYSLAAVLATRDKRLAASIDPVLAFRGHAYSRAGVAPFTSSTGYGVAKFDNTSLAVYNRNQINTAYTDAPIYWLSIIYLNYAEAKAELGTLTQTDLDNTINKLQARAGLPSMITTPEADPANNMNISNLLWEIRRCRRCELMFDNWYRYWDLIRWHQLELLDSKNHPNVFLGANLKNVANPEEAMKGDYLDASDDQIRTYESKHYLYPIPTGQLTLNKNMKQNPGW